MKKLFFTKHAKSSAALISLGLHVVLVIVALSFVAVTVITKDEQNFEAMKVQRPKMPLKKLQVPVNVNKKQSQRPKLRKRIVVSPKLNKDMPDIKMPDIAGVKGGLGSGAGNGFGNSAGLGFSMPEIDIFGVKSKGEKIVLILDSTTEMMADKMGGIPGYTIIKNELVNIVAGLPPTALFNVLVFDSQSTAMAFPSLVPANEANAQQFKEWILPLNAVSKGMGDRDWGLHTLGKGGVTESDRMLVGKFKNTREFGGVGNTDVRVWYRSAMLAQKMQADSIYILTYTWGLQRVATTEAGMTQQEWYKTPDGQRWKAEYQKALKLVEAENKRRRAAGQPPKAIELNEWALRREYYPNIPAPPQPRFYNFTPKDFKEGFLLMREENASAAIPLRSGIGSKRKNDDFSLNVIHFVPKGGDASAYNSNTLFKELAGLCGGRYRTISGLDEIQSYATADEATGGVQ